MSRVGSWNSGLRFKATSYLWDVLTRRAGRDFTLLLCPQEQPVLWEGVWPSGLEHYREANPHGPLQDGGSVWHRYAEGVPQRRGMSMPQREREISLIKDFV